MAHEDGQDSEDEAIEAATDSKSSRFHGLRGQIVRHRTHIQVRDQCGHNTPVTIHQTPLSILWIIIECPVSLFEATLFEAMHLSKPGNIRDLCFVDTR